MSDNPSARAFVCAIFVLPMSLMQLICVRVLRKAEKNPSASHPIEGPMIEIS